MDTGTTAADDDGGGGGDGSAPDPPEICATEERIKQFFSKNRPITQADADHTASRITGREVKPVPLQGLTSYTVAADETAVIHFRDPACMVDTKTWSLARQTYGSSLVPRCEPMGLLGHLHVYWADFVPGEIFGRVRDRFLEEGNEHLLSRVVQDLARFYATAWSRTPPIQVTAADYKNLHAEYIITLDRLCYNMPERFQERLACIRVGLSSLFDNREFPLVLSLSIPLEHRLRVDPSTGEITGATDWEDTEMEPFGTSLWGVETVFGRPSAESDSGKKAGLGWHFHQEHHRLRREFWEALVDVMGQRKEISDGDLEAVKTARMLGLLRAFGLDSVRERMVEDDENGCCPFASLDALIAVLYPDESELAIPKCDSS